MCIMSSTSVHDLSLCLCLTSAKTNRGIMNVSYCETCQVTLPDTEPNKLGVQSVISVVVASHLLRILCGNSTVE